MHTIYTKGQPFRWARLLSLLLLLLPLAGRAQVVISQVYAGGGSGTAGTSYKRDYVELFNSGTQSVNISGYSIQYASAGGAAVSGTIVIPASTTLAAGQYYSVLTGSAGTVGADLATPAVDLVAPAASSPSLSNTGGKIFLASNSTTVTFTKPATVSNNVVDFVGYGTGDTFEGAAAAPAPGTTATALLRAGAGCTDANNNSTDFVKGTSPAPRNVSTTLAPCGGSNPVPTITTLSPSSATAGDPAQTLTVSGTNFRAYSVVNFNGTGRATTFLSATTLTIQLTLADLATAGSYNVTVTTPTPGGGTTAASTFTVNAAPASNPVPTISSLSPSSVFVGAAAQTLMVNGTNFIGTSVVNFNGTARTTTYVSATQLTIQLTAGDQATLGSYDVTVTNPTPGGGTTAPSSFTVNPVPAPTLTAISPSNPVGGATYAFTLTGTTLGTTATTTVSFNGSTVTPTSVNGAGTSLVVSLPLPAAGGTFPITVTTANGTSGPQSLTVAAAPAGFFEPFEPGTRGGYVPAGSLTLRTGSYDFVYALLGNITPPGDKFNNVQSVRMQGGGSITMGFDKTGGAGVVTISAALYGTDAAASLILEYSTNGGGSYQAAPGSPVALSTTLTAYPFTLNVAGPVRLRISTSNTVVASSPRINVDDLQISDYAPLTDLTVTTGTPTSPTPIAGNYKNVTIAPGAYAILAGPLTVTGTLTILSGGGLAQNCQLLTGTGNFDLQAGGTLAICAAAGISPTGVPTGAVLLAGTRTYSPLAQYIYNGTLAQVTGSGLPSTIPALGVQNLAGVTLSQALSLTQGVNLNLGNLNTGGQQFTLLSSAAGTAGVVNTGGLVVGTATVQRYINSTNEVGYRHYSAPVSNTTLFDLTVPGVFTPTFNPAYNSSTTPGTVTAFPTVFGYDQSRIATTTSNFSAFDKGWFSPSSAEDPMVVAKGYSVNAPNTALVDFVGTLNSGNISTGTLNRGTDPNAGWQLVGNPYPSPIDWSTISAGQRPGMDAAVYVFESAGQYGGSYRSYVAGIGNPLIVSGQGCFVRVTTPGATGSVNLTNANRVTTFGPQPNFGRGTADLRPQVALTLQGATVMDDASVYFQAGATAGKDAEFDATKLANPHGLNLSSLAGGEALAINGLPALGTAPVLVPLSVTAPKAGSYSLKASALANLAGTTVTLVDALTGTRTALTAGTVYAFSLSSTTALGRFVLEFRPSGALATTAAQALSAQTQLFPNPASGSFRVQLPVLAAKTVVQATLLNTLGQTVLHRSLSAAAGQAIDAEFDVRALAPGVYTLRLNVNGTLMARKMMVE